MEIFIVQLSQVLFESLFCPAMNNKKMETLTDIQVYQSVNSRLALKDIQYVSAEGVNLL